MSLVWHAPRRFWPTGHINWADISAWLDEREEKEKNEAIARENEQDEGRAEEAATAQEKEKTEEKVVKQTTVRVEEGGEGSRAEVDAADVREVEVAEAPKRSFAGVPEPATPVSDVPRPPDHPGPVLLHRPQALAPIEVASLELV